MMRIIRLRAYTLYTLIFSAITASGQICYQPRYARTLACVPTLTADSGSGNFAIQFLNGSSGAITSGPYRLGTEYPLAAPLGIGAQYASQIASAPSAATSVGVIVSFDNGALMAKPGDFGPLFSDLPQTIGRHRLYVGISYQFLQFTKLGGRDIKAFNYTQYVGDDYFSAQNSRLLPSIPLPSTNTPTLATNPLDSSASFKVHNLNTYISFGVTDHLEVSAVIPFSKVLFGMDTTCSAAANYFIYTDSNGSSSRFCGYENPNPQVDANTFPGYYLPNVYDFLIFTQGSSKTALEPNGTGFGPEGIIQTSKGLGDVTLRAKYELLQRKREALAFGMEFRMPTGDPLNFKGSGAFGFRPFLAYGHSGRFSPHANIGYQYNGSSVNDVRDRVTYNNAPGNQNQGVLVYAANSPSTKLPNTFTATVGLDYAVSRRVNLDIDGLERVFSNDGSKAFAPPTLNGAAIKKTSLSAIPFKGTSVKNTLIFGSKIKLIDQLLLSANLMVDTNPGSGLSYKPSPIVTLSYDFGVTQK